MSSLFFWDEVKEIDIDFQQKKLGIDVRSIDSEKSDTTKGVFFCPPPFSAQAFSNNIYDSWFGTMLPSSPSDMKAMAPFPTLPPVVRHPWEVGPCEKYINIPSEKYIYVHIYVYICVYTYLCKMDEYRSHTILSSK